MALNIKNIGNQVCEPVGAFAIEVLIGLKSDFATIAKPKQICSDSGNAASTFEDLGKITLNHTMKSGKKLFKMKMVSESTGLVSTQIGEKSRRLFENTLTGTVPGSDAAILGAMRFLKNQDLIVFAKEFGSENYRQLGSESLPAWVESNEGTIEATVEGNNAFTIAFKDKSFGPAPIYAGTLPDVYTDSE